MPRPEPTEYADFYRNYVALVQEEDVLAALEAQLADALAVLRPVPENVGNVRHPPYTWSVKEVVGHIADAEQIMATRALCFARGDATPLPGFDENPYVRAADFDRTPLADLVARFEALRRANLYFFCSLDGRAWSRSGEASGSPVSVRALAYIIVGHARHHTAILRRRLSGT